MELPVSGAHGQLAASDGETAGLISQYVQSLQGTKPAGTDHLTPHTSTPWAEVEAAVDRHNAGRAHDTVRVGLLRRTLTGPLAELRMTSLDSALAATAAALDSVELPDTRLRYAVWGYGRAGQRYAALMDKLVVQGRRAMLVGLADSRGAQVLVHGLEHERATVFKQRNGRIPAGAGASETPADVLRAPADVLLLSGRGPALTLDMLPELKARVVVDLTGAVSPDIERALLAQGVVFVPSLIATAGPLVMAELERTGQLGAGSESSASAGRADVPAARAAIHRHTARLFARARAARQQHDLSMTEAVVSLGLSALCHTEHPLDSTVVPSQL
jgi:glutamate dehydrogenase/leucine dehydrogenase